MQYKYIQGQGVTNTSHYHIHYTDSKHSIIVIPFISLLKFIRDPQQYFVI